jgi:microcystin-dependent protein
MTEPFMGEIRIFSFNYSPRGWAMCNGQLLPINQNQGLFSLLGTTFGGDGRVNFALPDFRDRVPIHFGSDFVLGQRGGEVIHTLTISEMAQHTHPLWASQDIANSQNPTGNVLASNQSELFAGTGTLMALSPLSITNSGGSQAHENRQPYLTLNFCIALQGIFPSQT